MLCVVKTTEVETMSFFLILNNKMVKTWIASQKIDFLESWKAKNGNDGKTPNLDDDSQ